MRVSKEHITYKGLSIWALSFGGVIGWGCFVMPGTTFLPDAGPIGTVIGIILATAAALIICVNYGCMIEAYPSLPSSYVFTRDILGEDHAFLAIWSLALAYLSLLWANATAFVLLARYLLGGVFEWGFHYRIAGYNVYFGEILFTIFIEIVFGCIAVLAPRIARDLRTIFAVCLMASVVILFVAMLLNTDPSIITEAPFSEGDSPFGQVLNIAVLAPWLYVGFETVTQTVNHVRFSVKRLSHYAGIAIICGMLSYIFILLLASSGTPEGFSGWRDYTKSLGSLSGIEGLPAFYNANRVLGTKGLVLIGIAGFSALSTSMLCFIRATARILMTMSEVKLLPKFLGKLDHNQIPVNAVLAVLLISFPMPFLGRTAIGWNADVSTLSVAIVYTYVSICAFVTAKKEKKLFYRLTGIAGIIVSLLSFFLLLLPNVFAVDALAKESYFMLFAWSFSGLVYYWYIFRRDRENRFGKSTIMWIMMLFLLFFSENVWIRLQLEDVVDGMLAQGKTEVGHIFINYSLVQMGIVVVALVIILNLFVTLLRRQKDLFTKVIKAEERTRAKTDFLSNMSHDLRTPMNAIIGYTDLAIIEKDKPEKTLEYLENIRSSGRHMQALVNDVLEMSRIESGRLDISNNPFNLIELFDNIYSIMHAQAEAKDQTMTIDTSGIRHAWVNSDRLRINQIMMNLISNAVKYTPNGGVIDICAQEQAGIGETYVFTVTDNGMGMSEEFAERIFDAFERERNSTVSGIQGTGLGMAITKSIVDAMGGTISLKTKKGEGSCFTVTLKLPHAEEIIPGEKDVATEAFSLKGMRVLLVDDVEVNRRMAKTMLELSGIVVEMAVDGVDAVEKVEQAEPGYYDMILMDIQMPRMNGYEATMAIRSLSGGRDKVPILAMTANAFDEDIRKAKAVGMVDHIAKPIDLNDMLRKIANAR